MKPSGRYAEALAITDSQGAPRGFPIVVNYKDTWPGLLEEKLQEHSIRLHL
ncbi:MAG: hypothetical protein GKR96_10610 [Gammaproteobacteria bacterium]|nr:hypothetical protein [Gammaproteobacteria bacterium]